MPVLFEENQPEPNWPGPAADMFFHDAGDGFPVQPEPDAGPPPSPPRRAAAERQPKPAAPRYRDAPTPGGFAPSRQLVTTLVVLAIALIVLAMFVPRILRAARTDTVTGAVAQGTGGASWQVSVIIPEQAPAASFAGQNAQSAKVGLPVTISVPAAGISAVSGRITKLTARTADMGGGFQAVVQPSAGTKVIPSAGKTADVTLGS